MHTQEEDAFNAYRIAHEQYVLTAKERDEALARANEACDKLAQARCALLNAAASKP